MAKSDSAERANSRVGARIVLLMFAMVAIPASLTLFTIRFPGTLQMTNEDPTPRGYTWSLSLFVVPIAVIGWWFLRRDGVQVPKSAFWRTLAILAPLGCALDFFFASWFFYFPNRYATLGINLPVLGGSVPVEEYFFYLTGFIAILLIYVWLDEYWLVAYNVPDYSGKAKHILRLVQFHPISLIIGVILIVAAIAFKKLISGHPAGFPNYFIILVCGGLVPAVGFYRSARDFINWRAFILTVFMILLISLIWEATLAVPYGWWRYQPNQMLGIFIGGWSGLPIEAVCVWMAVTYGTVIMFEIVKLWLASDQSMLRAFLGTAK
jgi:hypothetical protein